MLLIFIENIIPILEARAILDTEKIEMLTERVRDVIESFCMDMDRISELICGASMAHHDLLSYQVTLFLKNIDLTQVPAQHLASLASCVTFCLDIENVSGCDLVSILISLKCEQLCINRQSLGQEETQSLVQAMESSVEMMWLGAEVTLDIEALVEYSGQEVCTEVKLVYDTGARYREEVIKWAKSKNWTVWPGSDDVHVLNVKEKS